jgi:hypothetical protein
MIGHLKETIRKVTHVFKELLSESFGDSNGE